jgi:hypothetical protein
MRPSPLCSALALVVLAAVPAGCATSCREAPPVEERVLRFRTREDLDPWAQAGGEWRVEGGVAVGRSLWPATDRYAWLTHRTHYGEIRRVVVHGGLDARSRANFRLGVGSVTVILNWEVDDRSLVHYRGSDGVTVGPHVLVPGREHEIVVEQSGDRIRLVVDDRLLWEEEGRLSGTVTVYPALGSTIRVRDVTIVGRPVPWVRVDYPSLPHF